MLATMKINATAQDMAQTMVDYILFTHKIEYYIVELCWGEYSYLLLSNGVLLLRRYRCRRP